VLVLVKDLTWSNAPSSLGAFAKANLSVRSAPDRPGPVDGFLTVGKGDRSGSAFGSHSVGHVTVDGSAMRLDAWPTLVRHDHALHRGGHLGAFGQALDDAGRPWALVYRDQGSAAAVANANGEVPLAVSGGAPEVSDLVQRGFGVLIVDAPLDELPAVAAVADGECVLVASSSSPGRGSHLGAVAASSQCGLGNAGLTSASTHRRNLVTLSDVAPTFLALVGMPAPASMLGTEAQPAKAASVQKLVAEDRRAVVTDNVRLPLVWLFVLAHVLAAAMVVRRGVTNRPLVAGLLAIPPASLLMMAVPWWRWGLIGALLVGGGITAGLGAVTLGWGRRGLPFATATVIAAATCAAVVLADALLRGQLEFEAPFGNSPVVAGRFFGVGNIGLGFMIAGVIVAGGWCLDRWGSAAVPLVAVGMIAATATVAAPMLGAKVGGVFTCVPAFGALLLIARSRLPSRRLIPLLGLLAVAALGLVVAIDVNLPTHLQTHLARTLEHGLIATTVARKGLEALRNSTNPFCVIFVAGLVAVSSLHLDWRGRPALRATALALLVAAVTGSLLNDSGLVVGAAVVAVGWPALVGIFASNDHGRAGVPQPDARALPA